MLESLLALAMVLQNDLDHFQAAIEPSFAHSAVRDDDLKEMLGRLRSEDRSRVQ